MSEVEYSWAIVMIDPDLNIPVKACEIAGNPFDEIHKWRVSEIEMHVSEDEMENEEDITFLRKVLAGEWVGHIRLAEFYMKYLRYMTWDLRVVWHLKVSLFRVEWLSWRCKMKYVLAHRAYYATDGTPRIWINGESGREFEIEWVDLGGGVSPFHTKSELTPRINIFNDAWGFLRSWNHLFEELAKLQDMRPSVDDVVELLERYGFEDGTLYTNPRETDEERIQKELAELRGTVRNLRRLLRIAVANLEDSFEVAQADTVLEMGRAVRGNE